MLDHDFEQSIGYWTYMVARAFERALNEELAPHGVTYRQTQVLAWLALDKVLTQAQLADRMNIEPPTLVGILDRMERDGWISRHADPADRRKKLIRATPRVKPVWDKIRACALRVRARATQDIDPEDLAQVRRILASVLENLQTPSLVQEVV